MPARLEDYALLGDTQTAALVSREGSIDWLCLPRFDSPACFAALVGESEHGRWLVAPATRPRSIARHYREATLVLETDYETDEGAVTVIDAMPPPADRRVTVVRLVAGRRGRVPMRMEFALRFGYGLVTPLLQRDGDDLVAVCGPDGIRLATPVALSDEDGTARADFSVSAGERMPFVLTWSASHEPAPPHLDPEELVTGCEYWWRTWVERCTYEGEWREAVVRSLLTLKALSYGQTGGLIAAPTCSLPEQLGGSRNWDYRYCWLRDAAFTLTALNDAGYTDEALAWRAWLLRAVAGDPARMQIVYGPAGERHLPEWHADWLPGYEDSTPVRIGNAAATQFQLDVYGELADSQYTLVLESGFHPGQEQVVGRVLAQVERAWTQPDEGIWEVRGERRHFTHSKVMAWVTFDRALKLVERVGLDGPVDHWRAVRDRIHADVCRNGFDAERNTFVQYYGGHELDASLLRMAHVGFLSPSDPRVVGTVDAIREELSVGDGLLLRYSPAAQGKVDGLHEDEGAFLACSFWLADNLALLGRDDEARSLFERLLSLRNDVGLLAEQYDPRRQRLVGNFPQALSHLALVNTALLLSNDARRRESNRQDREQEDLRGVSPSQRGRADSARRSRVSRTSWSRSA
jgi:GH15 family glucan-1,4-alpha-glucosidase